MIQDSMPPVLGFGIGGRNALYCQTWEETMCKNMIWREMVEESTDSLRIIPNTIKVLKTVLANRLVLWERGLVEEEMEMVKDIVDECMVGWLWKELGILHLESLLQSEVHEGDEEVQGQAGGEWGGGHGGGEHGTIEAA